MTSEAIVITQDMICVGADDRKTITENKSFDNVNKIYRLYKDSSIVMMINGPSRFAGLSFKKLADNANLYGKIDVKIVENSTYKFIEYLEDLNTGYVDLNEYITYHLLKYKNILQSEFYGIQPAEFEFYINTLETREVLPFLKDQKIDFDDIIPKFVVNKKELNKKLLENFSNYIYHTSSEVIISGFDEDTGLPALTTFKLYFKTKENVEYEIVKNISEKV